jgi:2-deoxy-D-gluconate 3-dehydrogenase
MNSIESLLSLTGKSAIVTGAAKGIGLGIAKRLAQAGASVLIADIDESGAVEAATAIAESNGTAHGMKVDVSNDDDILAMTNACLSAFGSIDILVNNAGIFPQKPIRDMTQEEFDRVMGINLRSVFLATQHVADAMRSQGRGGRIINITSVDALHPSMVGLAHYDASKHGVWGFTKNAALEYSADQIWINAIAPGGIATPGVAAMQQGDVDLDQVAAFIERIPMHRMGEPDDIAKVALFLASDMASYMTGEQIVVDGGALLR